MIFDVQVKLSWKITAEGTQFTFYTETVQTEFNRSTETAASFKAKLKAIYNQKVLADTAEADTIYALMNTPLA